MQDADPVKDKMGKAEKLLMLAIGGQHREKAHELLIIVVIDFRLDQLRGVVEVLDLAGVNS